MELLGPCGWWSEAVRAVAWRGPDGAELQAAAILGPELDSDGALDRARERAAPWLHRSAPGVLLLHEVTEAEGRSAWVYDATDGVSLGLVLAAPGDPLPVRVAAELVAACADILDGVGARAGDTLRGGRAGPGDRKSRPPRTSPRYLRVHHEVVRPFTNA